MTQDNIIKLTSTSMHGYLYSVYDKDIPTRILYMGEISDNPKYCWCECMAFVHGDPCYHQESAKNTMEIKI